MHAAGAEKVEGLATTSLLKMFYATIHTLHCQQTSSYSTIQADINKYRAIL